MLYFLNVFKLRPLESHMWSVLKGKQLDKTNSIMSYNYPLIFKDDMSLGKIKIL